MPAHLQQLEASTNSAVSGVERLGLELVLKTNSALLLGLEIIPTQSGVA